MLSLPTLAIGPKNAAFLSEDGEIEICDFSEVSRLIRTPAILVCHAPYTAQKSELKFRPLFDVLELYAFLYPTEFCVPTINGLAKALGLEPKDNLEDQTLLLLDIATHLIETAKIQPDTVRLLHYMNHQGQGWVWAPLLLEKLGIAPAPVSIKDISLWEKLKDWQEDAPTPPPSQHLVSDDAAGAQLKLWLSARKTKSEDRPQQLHYTREITKAFQPANSDSEPEIVLAEAGTGVGKTLGYLNPAWLWASQNKDTVWMSTYTKNLQRQLESELEGLIPKVEDEHDTVVIRKGRENYLCLLNLEEQSKAASLAPNPSNRIGIGLMLRWMMETKDGDFSGSSFHGWMVGLIGWQNTLDLSDQRGECLYGACDHYKKCFIEHAVRKSKKAKLVISNHALTMIQAALASPEKETASRYIFDEGHHLFDAADSAYAANLSLQEMLDLRRWLIGVEAGRKSRAKGLKRRLEGLYEGHERAEKIVDAITRAANALPSYDLLSLFRKGEPDPHFFFALRDQVRTRAKEHQASFNLYGLECDVRPVEPKVIEGAAELQNKLSQLRRPLIQLIDILKIKIEEETNQESPDTALINRLESVTTSIQRRCDMMLTPWIAMLGQLENPASDAFIDWFGIERIDGKDFDSGMYRRWVDPMIPFATTMSSLSQGMTITSATLRDSQSDDEDWQTAYEQTGARHFKANIHHFHVKSPFDYKEQSRIYIVNDIRKDQPELIGRAYASLMQASGGGALGIFTAIQRLKSLYPDISKALAEHDIPLYAQHVDEMDVGTLIDLFRDQENSCLIGTDAVRDGVDVPGQALRMIIFERVPWPRPTILHKTRRDHFGGRSYDERMTRLKLKQAFGRLIRTKSDRGVFVMLDPMLPSRLLNAFPEDVEIVKTSLDETLDAVKDFFK